MPDEIVGHCNCAHKEKQVCDVCQCKPYLNWCPTCYAAPTARCTKPGLMGSKFVEGYHAERIARAKQQATDSIVPPYLYNGKQYNFPTQDIYRMVSTHPDLIEVTPMLQSFEVKASAR